MIVTGEASGDMHGANLVRCLRRLHENCTFFGMGGMELERAGVDMLYDAARLSVVGLTEVFSHLPDIFKARSILIKAMRQRRPALLILIDFPDFNLMLAARARQLGIPVFYYISPQVWAWRSGRVHKIGRLAERVAVILPFEQDFYRQHGYAVDFVGHPLMDTVATTRSRQQTREDLAIDPDEIVVGLLPGSRRKEITALLPVFLAAAKLLVEITGRKIVFLLPRASTIPRQLLEENGLAACRDLLDIRVSSDNRYDVMGACDAVMAASGTVTLELAILGIPTIMAYRVSPRTYLLGRMLVRLEWFSLVNLIAGRPVIAELLQSEVTADNLAASLAPLLHPGAARQDIMLGFDEVKIKLGGPGASMRAAHIAAEMLENHERGRTGQTAH